LWPRSICASGSKKKDVRPLYDVAHDDVLRLIAQAGIK